MHVSFVISTIFVDEGKTKDSQSYETAQTPQERTPFPFPSYSHLLMISRNNSTDPMLPRVLLAICAATLAILWARFKHRSTLRKKTNAGKKDPSLTLLEREDGRLGFGV